MDDQSDNTEEENLWNNFQIDFERVPKELPDRKVHATIRIEPDSARRLIKNFTLLIDGYNHGEFEADSCHISITGFDTRKAQAQIRIRANSKNRKWKPTKKESNLCIVSLNDLFIGFRPEVNFEWWDDNSCAILLIEWPPIQDQSIKTYDVILDEKIIQNVKQQLSIDKNQTYVHHITAGRTLTLKVLAKLNDEKVKYQSDPLVFTVPLIKEDEMPEVISVQKEKPSEIIEDTVETKNEENTVVVGSTEFKKNARELDRKLRNQIARRRRGLK